TRHPQDLDIEHDAGVSARPLGQRAPVSRLAIREDRGVLVVSDVVDGRSWDGRAFMHMLMPVTNLYVVPRSPHTPRITIDDVIVHRESWTFRSEDVPFAGERDAVSRFAAARRWAREHGMPRFCFYRASQEGKPCFVDFESPIYVDVLAKLARAAKSVTVSEMLPTPDACWLSDGPHRYTSELRLVAVDPARSPR
ncbi:MAG TPA: lantibiotic dehydratase, partial [Minicystis sp.]|nr:lantibiotic dehydratase [Minicystis sp.]